MAPQPGWYDDADSTELLRYWDGDAWTERTAPKASSKRRSVPLPFAVGSAAIVLVLGIVIGAAAGSAGDPTESDEYVALQLELEDSVAEGSRLEEEVAAAEEEVRELTDAAIDAETELVERDTALTKRETDVQTREAAVADRETAVTERETTASSASRSSSGSSSSGGAAAQQPAAQAAPPAAAPSAYYENCTAARNAGAAPVREGQPGYGRHLDRDGDGVGCE